MIVRISGAAPQNPIQAVTVVTETGTYRFIDPDDVITIVPEHLVYVLRLHHHGGGKDLEVIREIVPWKRIVGIRFESGEPSEEVWSRVPVGSSMPLYFPDELPSSPKTNLN